MLYQKRPPADTLGPAPLTRGVAVLSLPNMTKGLFITIEGNEGCGKSTQIKLLEAALKAQGVTASVLREPGSTGIGTKIRNLLKDPENHICSEAELFLFQASRAQLVNEVIRPKLQAGEVVIADRFYDSTWVYQGWARKINLLAIEFTNRLATPGIEVAKTFLIKVPLAVCMERIKGRGQLDRFELEGEKLLTKIDAGYDELVKNFPSRVDVVDGNREVQLVHDDLLARTMKLIKG